MKVAVFLVLISVTSAFPQKPDSLMLIKLQKELCPFKPQLRQYSERLVLLSGEDSIKTLSAELKQKTGILLNSVTRLYGRDQNPYPDYSQDMAMASAMKDISPELAGVYEPNALLKLLDEHKPRFYKQLSSLHKSAGKVIKTKKT
jgi:sulfite reductase alpha subunit-like flavoprotein